MTRSAVRAEPASDPAPAAAAQDADDFIYLISHDVRASVRALIELPQWIVEDLEEAGVELGGPLAQTIEMMNRHTARLDQMLVDLLTYSRVGRMQDVGCLDVAAALDAALARLQLPDGMRVKRDIGCANVMMGAQDLAMLWTALIGNAVKHHDAPCGQICVRTQTEGALVRFTVSDDGPGIPERLHARALGAMTTLRPRDDVEGTGMGLACVHKLAQRYGGVLQLSEVENDRGGLRVDLVIPHGCGATP